MVFGMGYYVIIFLMMCQMKDFFLVGVCVFDYGCGIGILVILVKKLVVGFIDVVDIESVVIENIFVNMEVNGVDGIMVYMGILDVVLLIIYDIILVNINCNVILVSFGVLY